MSQTRPKHNTLPAGSRFGRYIIVKRLGRGGMGTVYEATHAELKKRVAIKMLHARVAQSAEVRARFQREGESAARIQHPNVVDIYDVGTEGSIPYLVMEYLEGHDLGQLLKRKGQLTAHEMADILLPVVCGLDVAHSRGVIHRDLKPSNIFVAKSALGATTPKLLDFGISKIIDEEREAMSGLTSAGTVLGTPYYMSPEQAHAEKVIDGRSDQYSLGVILYQCVTGERPFVADSMYQILHKIVQGEFAPPRERMPDLPPEMEATILRAMARQREDRFPNLLDFGRALLPFASPRVSALLEPVLGPDVAVPTVRPAPPSAAAASPAITLTPMPQPALFHEPTTPSDSIDSLGAGGSQSIMIPRSSVPGLVVLGIGLLVAATAIGVYMAKTSPAPVVTVPIDAAPADPPPLAIVPDTYDVRVSVTPKRAMIELDGVSVGVGSFTRVFERDGQVHRLRVVAEGYATAELTFTDEPPVERIVLRALPRAAERPAAKVDTPRPRPSAPPVAAQTAPKTLKKPAAAKPSPTKPAVKQKPAAAKPSPTKPAVKPAVVAKPAKAPPPKPSKPDKTQPKRGTNDALIIR